MLDSLLGKLILRRIGVDSGACEQALCDGVVTVADLDPKNDSHTEGVQNWLSSIPREKLTALPPGWLQHLPSNCVVSLAPIMPEAKARVVALLRDGFNIENLVWPEPFFPAAWAKAVEKVLLDKPNWDKFHAVQDKLPVDMVARLRKDLAAKIAVQERKDKEEKRAARGNAIPKVDPLEVSIQKRDVRRLRKLPLEKLSQVRWEKYKDEWMKSTPEIVALAAKVPAEFTRPYEAKILAALAESNWEPMPVWPITKSCLQELEIRHQASFLQKMFCALSSETEFNDIEPSFTWEEIRNVMMAATLQDSDNIRLSRWLDAMGTFKHLRSLKGSTIKLSETEIAQFKMAMPADDAYVSVQEWLNEGDFAISEACDIEIGLDLLKWVMEQPKEKHAAYGSILRRSTGMEEIFGDALKADIK